MFPSRPTVRDISHARCFEEPLVPIGGEPTPGENAALAGAITGYSQRSHSEDFSHLTNFLEAHPNSEIYRRLPSSSCNVDGTIAQREPNSLCAECQGSGEAQQLLGDSLVQALRLGWDRALAGDGQERANWRVVEGNEWSWQQNAVCAKSNGSEWSAYEYSRCDTQALRALRNFVVEVTISGRAEAAGLSFGPYKDFLAELSPHTDRHHLQLEVDGTTDNWTFRIDGQLAERSQWNSAVRNTADLVAGTLTLMVRGANCVAFRELALHTLHRSLRTFCDHHLLPPLSQTAVESPKLGTPKPGFRCPRNFGGQSEQPRWHSRALGGRLKQLSTCSRAGSTNGTGFGHKQGRNDQSCSGNKPWPMGLADGC